MAFGELMRGHRRRLRVTQEELAERTGISVRGIRNLEAGRSHAPRLSTLRVLADAFALEGAELDRFLAFGFDEQLADPGGMHETHSPGLDPHPFPLAGDGWHSARLSVLVRLDTPGVEIYQDWRIIADRDGLDQITSVLTTPHRSTDSTPASRVDVRYGAKLLSHTQPLPHRSQFTLALPRPLQAGQSHECGIVIRVDPGQPMRPHYVLTATRPCDQFTLRVRFHPERPPRWVRRVCGEPIRVVDAVAPGKESLDVDAVGEIYTEFDQPTMYLAYGAQWQPAETPTG